jgi:4-diphosphocytidyl-2-C-methyl-D-erythritol kinase
LLLNKLQDMQLSAPAKINLSFQVMGRRPDGFHEIETVMAPISLSDVLTIEPSAENGSEVNFSCNDPSLPFGDDNLVVRAARRFLETTGVSGGVTIALDKKIPPGAGLGGGSSDAASTFLGLNELFGTRLHLDGLYKLAASIGSDVPFFMARAAAVCRGRGEIVAPMKLRENFPLLLVKPDFGVPTPWAYRRWKDSRPIPTVDYSPQLFRGVRFANDLERPVFEKFVFLAHLKEWLRRQPQVGAALMSGSGSTVFAVLQSGANGHQLGEKVRGEIDPSLWTFVCETVG